MESEQDQDFEERAYLYAGILAKLITKMGGEINVDMENFMTEFSLIYKFENIDGKQYLKMKVVVTPKRSLMQ